MLHLLHMLDKWTGYLESGGQTDAVYTDETDYDTVNTKHLSFNASYLVQFCKLQALPSMLEIVC